MKSTWPPPHVIFVGLELNQHGQAASQEQASSSCPVIFHGVLSFGSSVAPAVETKQKNVTASAPSDERTSNVVFIVQDSTMTRASDNQILCLRWGLASFWEQRVTRLELATSSLARRCSTTELHPRFLEGSNNVQRSSRRNLLIARINANIVKFLNPNRARPPSHLQGSL